MHLLTSLLVLFSSVALGTTRDHYKQAVRENSGKFRACYSKSLRRNPDLSGTISMSWTVDENGAADRIYINESKTTLNDRLLQKCMIKELQTWKFPAASKGKFVHIASYPFVFIPTQKE